MRTASPSCALDPALNGGVCRALDQLPAGLQFNAEELEEESEILKAFDEGALELVSDMETVLKEHRASAEVTLSRLRSSAV